MLTITVPATENWDEVNNKFVYSDAVELHLEHSLLALSKWESIFEKPFLSNDRKTEEETYTYIQCMGLGDPIPKEVLYRLSDDNLTEINKYIEAKHSATWFTDAPGAKRSRELITAEVIYYWMVTMQIPLEYELRHLNQLFTLVKVINEKNKPAKKMGRAEQLAQQRALNEQRRAQMGTSG